MTSKKDNSVINVFADMSLDWTPASAKEKVRLVFAPFADDIQIGNRCANVLSDTELQRAERFVQKKDGRHFIQRRAFRRYCATLALGSNESLSRFAFDETDKGRPYLPDQSELWFSFSSCPLGFLGAWSSTHAIGVDLEDITKNVEAVKLTERYFSESEAKYVNSANASEQMSIFFRLWCLKEAALKSIGEGLPFGLGAFEFDLGENVRIVLTPDGYGGPEQFSAYLTEENDICAAVVIRELV